MTKLLTLAAILCAGSLVGAEAYFAFLDALASVGPMTWIPLF